MAILGDKFLAERLKAGENSIWKPNKFIFMGIS